MDSMTWRLGRLQTGKSLVAREAGKQNLGSTKSVFFPQLLLFPSQQQPGIISAVPAAFCSSLASAADGRAAVHAVATLLSRSGDSNISSSNSREQPPSQAWKKPASSAGAAAAVAAAAPVSVVIEADEEGGDGQTCCCCRPPQQQQQHRLSPNCGDDENCDHFFILFFFYWDCFRGGSISISLLLLRLCVDNRQGPWCW